MKKLFFVLLLSVGFIHSVEAQWCGRPCLYSRYYSPTWVNDNSWYYGYFDINEYPYSLPVNCYFNPRPCPNPQWFGDYNYVQRVAEQPRGRIREQPRACCPKCNGYHK